MTTYKLRAECSQDVYRFYRAMKPEFKGLVSSFRMVQRLPIPDVELTFKSKKSLPEIRKILSKIVDGHVMLETVQPLKKYTGEREDLRDF